MIKLILTTTNPCFWPPKKGNFNNLEVTLLASYVPTINFLMECKKEVNYVVILEAERKAFKVI